MWKIGSSDSWGGYHDGFTLNIRRLSNVSRVSSVRRILHNQTMLFCHSEWEGILFTMTTSTKWEKVAISKHFPIANAVETQQTYSVGEQTRTARRN